MTCWELQKSRRVAVQPLRRSAWVDFNIGKVVAKPFVPLLHPVEFLIAQRFDVQHVIPSRVGRSNELIQFEVDHA